MLGKWQRPAESKNDDKNADSHLYALLFVDLVCTFERVFMCTLEVAPQLHLMKAKGLRQVIVHHVRNGSV